jgi:hypothetical protein
MTVYRPSIISAIPMNRGMQMAIATGVPMAVEAPM